MFRADIEMVIADLGDGYIYAEDKPCDYDGLDKTCTFPEATFHTNPPPEGDLLNEIYSVRVCNLKIVLEDRLDIPKKNRKKRYKKKEIKKGEKKSKKVLTGKRRYDIIYKLSARQ